MQNNKDQEETRKAPRDANTPTAEQIRVFQTTWWTPRPEGSDDEAAPPAAFTKDSTEVSRMMAGEQIEMKAHIDKLLENLDDGKPPQITKRSCP